MRAVVQRVSSARVTVAGEITGEIGRGFLVLLGVAQDDTDADAQWLAEKICALRVFEDADGKMNLSVRDLPADDLAPHTSRLLVVSQFTLFASTRKGTRPSFNDAAKPGPFLFTRRSTATRRPRSGYRLRRDASPQKWT